MPGRTTFAVVIPSMIFRTDLSTQRPTSEVAILTLRICTAVLIPWACLATNARAEPDREIPQAQLTAAPDFQRHVVPLLGTLGCNGRSCHGSFQGRGGLRLSLFGYDFATDHQALSDPATTEDGLRLDRKNAADSLVLRKPLLQTDHEGGQRFEVGSWEHQLLQNWIRAGASPVTETQELESLTVRPNTVVFHDGAREASLRVIATWKDGTQEDVTALCRFRSNNDAVVTVDRSGKLLAQQPGDTYVVAFYDNGVASVPVMQGAFPPRKPRSNLTHPIDGLVDHKLAKLGIETSDLCTDAEFLRRVSIDLTGTLPTPNEILEFLANTSCDKRSNKVHELFDRPEYAAWWANKLCDFTGCNPAQQAELGQELALQWYEWIRRRLEQNIPYDKLVEGIFLATGRAEGQNFEAYATEVSSYFRDHSPADFAQRSSMPHYWSRRSVEEPHEKALAVAHSFLGIRLQCAQCHKHPWDQWTQKDFEQFSSFFAHVRYGLAGDAADPYEALASRIGMKVRGHQGMSIRPDVLGYAQDGDTIPWREVYIARRDAPARLRLLRQRAVELQPEDDPRVPIMDWMRDPKNPWFARALVNRVWASYFHRGLIEPTDDLNPSNPPSNPALLRWLEENFIAHGFDMKWLHFQILSSDTYQRSWRPNRTNAMDQQNHSRAVPRRIPAEVVYDALKQVTVSTSNLDDVRRGLDRRATGHLSMRLAGTYAMNVFGKPERGLNCDCERVNDPTLLQAVFVQNDPLVRARIEESGWIAEVRSAEESKATVDTQALVTDAYLRSVSRPPTNIELVRATAFLDANASRADGLQGLLWALINTKEFILQH